MKKLLLALLLLWPTSASAVNRYVRDTGGIATGECTDSLNRCTLAYANTKALPGDVIHMRAGSYTTLPRPTNNPSAGGSGWIEYRGDTGDYDAVRINVRIEETNYLDIDRVKYYSMRFNDGFAVGTDRRFDSSDLYVFRPIVKRCHIVGRVFFDSAVEGVFDSNLVDTCSVADAALGRCTQSASSNNSTNWFWVRERHAAPTISTDTKITNNTINLSTGKREFQGVGFTAWMFAWGFYHTRRNLFANNTVNLTWSAQAVSPAPDTDIRGVYIEGCFNDTMRFNRWNLTDYTPSSAGTGNRVMFRYRDNVRGLYVYGDTFYVRGRTGDISLASQGENNQSCRATGSDSSLISNNRMERCVWDWDAGYTSGTSVLAYVMGMCGDTLIGNTFRSTRSPIISVSQLGKGDTGDLSTVIQNNTFISSDKTAPIVEFAPTVLVTGNSSVYPQLIIRNNIFASTATGATTATGTGLSLYNIDNALDLNVGDNLYWFKPKASTDGDHAFSYKDCTSLGSCGSLTFSYPGETGSFYAISGGQDAGSKYGSPGFLDSTLTSDGRWRGDISNAMFGSGWGFAGSRPYRRLWTFRPVPTTGDSSGVISATYFPGTWDVSGTKVQSLFRNQTDLALRDSLANPRVFMSDSLESILVGSLSNFYNQAEVPTSAESLAWVEGSPRHTAAISAPLAPYSLPPYSTYRTHTTTRQEADSAGTTAWTWNNLQLLSNYGPRITTSWTSQPAANSYLQFLGKPYLEVWGWPTGGWYQRTGVGNQVGTNFISPSMSLSTYDACTGTYHLLSGGNDSTTISLNDSLAYKLDPVNNRNRRPTVEVIAYDPRAQFRRSWFDGPLGTISDSAVVLYRGVPATRDTTFTTSYTLPSTSAGYHILRARTIDGNGDWQRNNWSIGNPFIARTTGGGLGGFVRVQADLASGISGTINTNSEYSNFSNFSSILIVVVTQSAGATSVSSATWGGQNALFGGRHIGTNSGVTVEYWYVNDPISGAAVPYNVTFTGSNVNTTTYFIGGNSTYQFSPFANFSYDENTSSTPSITLPASCASSSIIVTCDNAGNTQTLGTGEGVLDLSTIGTSSTAKFYLTSRTSSLTDPLTLTHILAFSSVWFMSGATLHK